MLSKIHVLLFSNESQTKSKKLLELVHCKVCGTLREKSIGGSKYFVSFIDDIRGKFLYISWLSQTSHKIKSMRTDNGKEFMNYDFNAYLEKEGIRRQPIYTNKMGI